MNISPVNYDFSNINRQNTRKTQAHAAKTSQPAFTSLFADANARNERQYGIYCMINPGFNKLKSSSTRIFREFPSQQAIAKLLNPDEKSEIKVLGCADGSEAWAYAIQLNEENGGKAKDNVKVVGVDIAPYMVEAAKTGRIIMSDVEKSYAEKSGNPLKGDGWDKYLTKTNRPQNFNGMLLKWPFLTYVEADPVVNKAVGSGLDWYEINKDELPDVSFESGDMMNFLEPDSDAQNVVYVVANSAGYLTERSTDDYIALFERIKEENKDNNKNVYVVTGSLENRVLSQGSRFLSPRDKNKINGAISSMGFQNISDIKLRKMGVNDYKDASSKIKVLKKS